MSDELFSIKGKRIFVTGGASGIGRMISEGLAERGARVFTASRRKEQLDELLSDLRDKRGFDVAAEPANLSDPAEVERIVAHVEKHFDGKLDVLINNAGATWGAPLGDYPMDGWDKVFDLNVKGLFHLSQKCLPMLAKAANRLQDPARIINLGSISAIQHPTDNAWAYFAAKAAVHHLSQCMAKTLVGQGITVNTIAPGLFPSKMTKHIFKAADAEVIGQHVPIGRVGMPSDMVGTVVFLSSRASAYMTGAIITLDGGEAL